MGVSPWGRDRFSTGAMSISGQPSVEKIMTPLSIVMYSYAIANLRKNTLFHLGEYSDDNLMAQPPLNVSDFLENFRKAAVVHGFQITTFGETECFPLIALTKKATSIDRPHLYLSSGIHGDEPAGPQALLSLLQDGFFNSDASWTICPLLNASTSSGVRPSGCGSKCCWRIS